MQCVRNSQTYGQRMMKHKDLQLIIPMTGNGARFVQAGITTLKPFIRVHERPMIEWILRMFPNFHGEITFICRGEHLDSFSYIESTLKKLKPNCRILRIDAWEKKGPVFDIMKMAKYFDDDAPVIISYCDFYMHWDYQSFITSAINNSYAGAVPCYSGFHPHLLKKDNLYASCKVDHNEMLVEIREKYSWTPDKTLSKHSPGIYFFRTGALMKQAFSSCIDKNNNIGGEYYASLPFNELVNAGLNIWCPSNVNYFCQWGTPEDLADYNFWVNSIINAKRSQT